MAAAIVAGFAITSLGSRVVGDDALAVAIVAGFAIAGGAVVLLGGIAVVLVFVLEIFD